jgi:predicted ArsR family transcriptional regulator
MMDKSRTKRFELLLNQSEIMLLEAVASTLGISRAGVIRRALETYSREEVLKSLTNNHYQMEVEEHGL